MNISINGKNELINQQEVNVINLLTIKEVKLPDMVSVQINGNILERDDFETTIIKENDEIEFLYFMGGGSR